MSVDFLSRVHSPVVVLALWPVTGGLPSRKRKDLHQQEDEREGTRRKEREGRNEGTRRKERRNEKEGMMERPKEWWRGMTWLQGGAEAVGIERGQERSKKQREKEEPSSALL